MDFSGHLGLGDLTPTTPLTYLHINQGALNNISVGYRPWMRTGVFMSEASDAMYVGLRGSNENQANAIINWSDDNAGSYPDPLRFIFTSTPDSSSTANRFRGLEIARMIPASNGNEGFLGVGDFFSATTQPTQRLDVLDGRVRIRQLPTDVAMDTEGRFVVTDANGVLGWRNIPPGTLGCEWNQFGGANNLRTAWAGAASGCPDEVSHVGIGAGGALPGKLTIVKTSDRPAAAEFGLHLTMKSDADNVNQGIFVSNAPATGVSSPQVEGVVVEVQNGDDLTQGLYAYSRVLTGNYSELARGVYGRGLVNGQVDEVIGTDGVVTLANGSECRNAFGLHGTATSNAGADTSGLTMFGVFGRVTGNSTHAYGVKGEARNGNGAVYRYGVHGSAATGSYRYGVYGKAVNTADSWAGYFSGKVYATSGYFPSDQMFKSNIEEMSGSMERIMALTPSSYSYNTGEFPQMGFSSGAQYGFIAQELESVLPELVTEIHQPAGGSEEDGTLGPSVQFKAINYVGLIPFLVGALQEQQEVLTAAQANEAEMADQLADQAAAIDELRAQMADMQQAIAACCAAHGSDGEQRSGTLDEEENLDLSSERLLRIDPNPFTDRTTIRYTLERGGRTMLLVNSSDGKQLQVLQEAVKQAGEYLQEWHTSHLAPGIYYVTLLLDGEPLVKRAVKVQ